MKELKPCPICGKMPKVKIDYGYEANGFGGWVIIQCKPLLRKSHLKIEEGKSTNKRALEFAIDSWNARVRYFEESRKLVEVDG